MIIRTNVSPKKFSSKKVENVSKAIKNEEVVVKPVVKTIKKKDIPTIIEEPIIEKEQENIESEIEDLKPWLEEDIDD